MSRTDRDVPVWVRADFYEPSHAWRCETGRYGSERCTLPAGPKRRHRSTERTRRRCHWRPVRDWRTRETWFRGGCWRDPQRSAVRDSCRAAVQHHRADEELDLVPIEAARPTPGWDYW